MTTLLTTPDQALDYLASWLSAPPSAGLRRLVGDLAAAGLPIRFSTQTGSRVGTAQLRPEGIEIALPDGAASEGAAANPLARALLETRGWPVLFAAEASDTWIGRIQAALAWLLDDAAGIVLQRQYGVDGEAYETELLEAQAESIRTLHAQASLLAQTELNAEQEVEYGVGIALTVLNRFWRTGNVPVEYWHALDLIPGSRALFDALCEFAPDRVPNTGWAVRLLMANIIERIDDYMEIKGNIRPLMVLTHFVPAVHPDDAEQALGNVARIVLVPLVTDQPGEHSVLIVPHRDTLPFGFRQVLADEAAIRDFGDRLAHSRYKDFCRALVPESFVFWQPTGEAPMLRRIQG